MTESAPHRHMAPCWYVPYGASSSDRCDLMPAEHASANDPRPSSESGLPDHSYLSPDEYLRRVVLERKTAPSREYMGWRS